MIDSQKTREQRLRDALIATKNEPSAEKIYNLIKTSVQVHRQGSGLPFSHTEQIISEVFNND